jgi:RNA polymerase sigma factor CnrH
MSDDNRTDEELIQAYYDGSDAAFQVLYARYFPELVRHYRRLLFDRGYAEDLAQEVFARVIRTKKTGVGRFDPTHGIPFRVWLNMLAGQVFVDYCRRKARELPTVALQPADPDARGPGRDKAAPGLTPDEIAAVWECLARLPEIFWIVFVLREIVRLSQAETARLLEINEMTVGSRLFRAKEMLRACLDAE